MDTRDLRLPLALLPMTLLVSALFAGPVNPGKAAPAAAATKDEKKEPLPLKGERTIEFTTDEGTWLSLDVAPDGKTLVFELLGDLYTLAMEGGEAKPITSGMAYDSQPRFSPDGKRIVFVSDRDGCENLWLISPDGSNPRPLTKDTQATFASPAWLSDGEYVIASRQTQMPVGTFELWLYNVHGGSGLAVIKAKAKPDTPPEKWRHVIGAVASPDGKYLYFTERAGFFNNVYNVKFPLSQIVRHDRVTGDDDTITDSPGSAFRPLLSPDGTKLVFGTRYETETALRIRDLKTGDERWLKYPVQRDDQESLFTRDFLPGYAFTPDGRELVVSYGGKIHRLDIATGADREVPFTAKVAQKLGPRLDFPVRVDDGPVKARLIQDPAPSPDGKRLAFSALTHLYVMDIAGGKPTRLTDLPVGEYQPAWSPDGQWISFVTWTSDGGRVWKTRADGKGTPSQLTHVAAYYRDMQWAPDGTRLVGLRDSRDEHIQQPVDGWGNPTPTRDLVWLPADGGDATVILPARGAGRPQFVTGEKDRVYVYTQGGLMSLRFDGTDRRTYLKVVGKRWFPGPPEAGEGGPAEDVRISPNGNWALALVSGQLYLVAVPRMGGEPPTVDVTMAAAETETPAKPKADSAPPAEGPQSTAGNATFPVKRLTDIGADYFAWADGGTTITWAIGSGFFRRPLASVSWEAGKPAVDAKARTVAAKKRAKSAAGSPAAAESTPPTPAQESVVTLEFPRHRPKGSVVLRGATVITMRNRDDVIGSADILVTDNRIAKVGPRGSFEIPAVARVIDVTGSTILPGFVDTHAHWIEIRRGVLDTAVWPLFANLAYGVTTARDPQTGTNDTFAYQDLVDTGEIIGLRAFSTGPGIFPLNNFQSAEEVKSTVARYKKYYRTHTLKSYVVGNRRQRQWMVQACKALDIMPTTEGALDLKLDTTHVIDGFSGNEHSIPNTPLYKDVVQLWAQSRISYTPTLIVAYGGPWAENYWYESTDVHEDQKLRRFVPHNIVDGRARRRQWFAKDEHVFPRLAAQAGKIIEAGGRVCIGSHGQLQGLGYHWEMWSLAAGGVSNMDVLRAATIHGAEAIGYAQDLGSIEAGKLADLLVLARDPREDIRNTNTLRYVMKDGEIFSADTLDQLWPREKKFAPLWWWNEKP